MLDAPTNEKWCEYVDCDEPWENGVTFRPRVGNAVFWQNMREDGRGDERTIHAGLPVVSGKKVGMNIWTRQWPLSEEFREVHDDL
jgi:prolyl 4-hydroxylase